MPDDELLNESGVPEEESSVPVEPLQEQESSSDSLTDDIVEDLESDIPEDEFGDSLNEPSNEDIPEEIPDIVIEDESIEEESFEEGSAVSDIDYEQIQEMIDKSVSENNLLYLSEDSIVMEDLEEFESSTILVDRYQYAIIQDLEFMKYALCIIIALLFLNLFMRYKK